MLIQFIPFSMVLMYIFFTTVLCLKVFEIIELLFSIHVSNNLCMHYVFIYVCMDVLYAYAQHVRMHVCIHGRNFQAYSLRISQIYEAEPRPDKHIVWRSYLSCENHAHPAARKKRINRLAEEPEFRQPRLSPPSRARQSDAGGRGATKRTFAFRERDRADTRPPRG